MHTLSCENEFYLQDHLTTFRYRGPGELENGLFNMSHRNRRWQKATKLDRSICTSRAYSKPHFDLTSICNSNRTSCHPIRSVIIRVINKIGRPRSGSPICLITSMITDRIGRHKVLLPINKNFNKICDIIGYFLNQHTGNLKFCFANSEKKKAISVRAWWRVLSNYLGMTHTVRLNCPIKAEIRAVDSQSDLTTLL